MQEQQPSRTALGAAAHRAAHQTIDGGRIFEDPLAMQILGDDRDAILADPRRLRATGLRLFIALRSAIAERALAKGVETRGVTQAVILGAGLDTFAYRNPFEGRVKVFEVDHPATQAWKRRRLSDTGIAVPDSMVFVPVDLEREPLMEALIANGFDANRRTFFVWLGVTYYLTRDAILKTFETIGAAPGGGEVAFDYGEPPRKALFLFRRASTTSLLNGSPRPANRSSAISNRRTCMRCCSRWRGFSAIDDRSPRELFGPISRTPRWLLPSTAPMSPWPGRRLVAARRRPG